MTALIAYHNDPAIKTKIIAQLEAHRAADQLVKGQYWEGGKGCAVGCTLNGQDHAEYEVRFGVPEMLARLEDAIFEGLPNGDAMEWPVRFMSSIRPGADLSRVGWQFLHYLLTDDAVNPGINHPLVRDAIRQCADVVAAPAKGIPIDRIAAWSSWRAAVGAAVGAADSAADSAAWSSWRAAMSAAESAMSAADSARSARSAGWSAAVGAATFAVSAAGFAAESTWSAGWSATRSAARSAAWQLMAEKLTRLLEAA